MNSSDKRADSGHRNVSGQNAPPFCFRPWTPPFSYDPHGTRIVDSQDRIILDVRGWGFLTGKGHAALGINEEKACSIQDAVGEHITNLLNASSVPDGNDSSGAGSVSKEK